jgi:hypothetical protein
MVEKAEAYEAAVDNEEEDLPACRPWLVFLPSTLVPQLLGQATQFSDFWSIKVFADARVSGRGVRKIKSLERDDPIFDQKNPDNVRTLVLVSDSMYDTHNGISVFVKEFNASRKAKDEHIDPDIAREYDSCPWKEWSKNLAGLFEGVAVDEAQVSMRNRTSYWVMVHWLEPSMMYLFSGSPVPRGLKDLVQLCAQLVSPKLELLATKGDRGEGGTGYRPSQNPYDFPDDDPRVKFQASVHCFKKFILNNLKIADDDKERIGQKFLRNYMLRRDYNAACPIGSSNTISRNMPPLRTFYLERPFMPKAQMVYDVSAAKWEKRRYTIKDSKQPNGEDNTVPNSRSIRALAYLTFCSVLASLDLENPDWVDANERKKARLKRVRDRKANAKKKKKQAKAKRGGTKADGEYVPDSEGNEDGEEAVDAEETEYETLLASTLHPSVGGVDFAITRPPYTACC